MRSATPPTDLGVVPARWRRLLLGVRVIASGALASSWLAASATAEQRSEAVTHRYEVCGAATWLLGENWRPVWSEPIEVEVLDQRSFAGGLRPVETVGSYQTLGLALEGADGRAYTFRSLEKRGDAVLPAALRPGPVGGLLRDQASANLPGADLLAADLSRRLGVRIGERRLVAMADDPTLGEHREVFAGRIGTLSEYPTPGPAGAPGTFGATEIIDTAELWEKRVRGERADVAARAYLRARLIDWWIGDWDRHPEQWRWGLVDDEYVPLPEDHDHAFTHFDGVLSATVRPFYPWLGPYDEDFTLRAMTHNSWWLDAWILVGLGREAWLEEIAAFEASIGPEVVDAALESLPEAWRELVADDLRATLQARAAVLRDRALAIQASISRIVHVYGSDRDDRVDVACGDDGSLAVVLSIAGEERLRRVFDPEETERIDLHLFDGHDRVVRSGQAACRIALGERRGVRMERGVPSPIDRVRDRPRPGVSRIEPRF